MWVFANPAEARRDGKKYPTINYEYAQAEIATKNGISMTNSVDTGEQSSLFTLKCTRHAHVNVTYKKDFL